MWLKIRERCKNFNCAKTSQNDFCSEKNGTSDVYSSRISKNDEEQILNQLRSDFYCFQLQQQQQHFFAVDVKKLPFLYPSIVNYFLT